MPTSMTAQNLADALLRGALAGSTVAVSYQPTPAFWDELVWWMEQMAGGYPVEVIVEEIFNGRRLVVQLRPNV